MKKLALLSMLTVLFTFACGPAEQPAEPAPAPEPAPAAEAAPEPEPPTAVAELHDAEGKEVGKATFTQSPGGVLLVAEVTGVEPAGQHGFHVHEVGECVPPFTSAGGHFDPKGTPHACPPNPERHAGDFGNIEINNGGGGGLEITSELVTVDPGETSVVGRAVILHAGTDDCVGQPTGDAGSRLACGVIKVHLFDAEDMEAETGKGGE